MLALPSAGLAVLLLLADSGVSTGRVRPDPCRPAKSKTALINERARIYIVKRGSDFTASGCSFATRRPVVLNRWFNCNCSAADQSPPRLWLVGEMAAYATFGCPPPGSLEREQCFGRVASVDLRKRQTVRGANAPGVSALVLKRNGSMAFVLSGAVRKLDAGGPGVLDPGPGVQPDSLALAGSRVYWMRNAQPFTALIS